MKKIIISILHYGDPLNTLNCLNSIKKLHLEGLDIETIVMDNGTKDPLMLDENEFKEINLKLLRNNYNAGFSGGHNLVFEKIQDTDFDFFLLLNNDSLLDKNCLKALVKGSENENIGGVVPKIYFTTGREFHKNRYKNSEKGRVIWYAGGDIDWANVQARHRGVDEVDKGQYDAEMTIDFASGACLLLKKSVLKKLGLFDERYFLYFEDADLSQKIIKAGYALLYEPNAVLWHNNAGSSSSGSELHDYFLTRNRMLFGMKFAPLKIKALLLRESIRLLKNGRRWQKKGIKDYYLRRFGKGSFDIK